jgi:hypothetical protein
VQPGSGFRAEIFIRRRVFGGDCSAFDKIPRGGDRRRDTTAFEFGNLQHGGYKFFVVALSPKFFHLADPRITLARWEFGEYWPEEQSRYRNSTSCTK